MAKYARALREGSDGDELAAAADQSESESESDEDSWQEGISINAMGMRLGLTDNLNVSQPTDVVRTPEQEFEVYCRLDFIAMKDLDKVTVLQFWQVSHSLL